MLCVDDSVVGPYVGVVYTKPTSDDLLTVAGTVVFSCDGPVYAMLQRVDLCAVSVRW